MPEIMIAVRPGTVYLDGRRRMVRKGRTTAHSTHPIVTQHPKLWAPLKVDYASPEADSDLTEYLDAVNTAVTDLAERTQIPPHLVPGTPAGTPDVDNAAVREWAAHNGIEVSPKGKIPAAVVEQYRAAQQEEEVGDASA